MFFIRADANSNIGSGHIMRCLAIAKELRDLGQQVVFITADRESEVLLKQHSFTWINLESIWNSLDEELPKLLNLISEYPVKALLVDSYFISRNYMNELKKVVKVIYMDDLNLFVCPADLVINYHIYAEKLGYRENYPVTTKLLLGCNYVPLRKEFTERKRMQGQRLRELLITTGGGDQYNIAGQLVTALRKQEELNRFVLHIVVGPLYKDIALLEGILDHSDNILLHRNVTDMAELMADTDIAISAGGSTLYELCSCGVPTVSFSYADNQWPGVKEFDRLGLIPYAGDFRVNPKACVDQVIKETLLLCNNAVQRNTNSISMMQLVDGYGANRIAKELLIL